MTGKQECLADAVARDADAVGPRRAGRIENVVVKNRASHATASARLRQAANLPICDSAQNKREYQAAPPCYHTTRCK